MAHARLNLSRMHSKNTCTAILPTPALQFGRHMPQHLIQCSFAGAVGTKSIFIVPKEASRSRVRGDKYHLGRWRSWIEIDEFLGTNDRSDCVGVQVESKVRERAVLTFSHTNSLELRSVRDSHLSCTVGVVKNASVEHNISDFQSTLDSFPDLFGEFLSFLVSHFTTDLILTGSLGYFRHL